MGEVDGSVRQQARVAAMDAQAVRRRERRDRDRRLDRNAVEVLTALAERDAAAAAAELRAGQAISAMVEEGLTLRQVADWCGDPVSLREAGRLLHRAERPPESAASTNVDR